MAVEHRWRDRRAGLVHVLEPMYQMEWQSYPPPTRGYHLVSTSHVIGYEPLCGYPRRSTSLANETRSPVTCLQCLAKEIP